MSDWSDIGAELRKERESRGWTLRDVAHRTRIPAQTIEKLESNDYRKFPSPAYAKSFLAQYSEHLEVDADDWLEAFEVGNSLSNLDSYEYLKDHAEEIGEEIAPVKTAPKRPARAKKAAAPAAPVRSESSNALQSLVVFAITAILLTAGALGFRHISEEIAKTQPTEEESTTKSPHYVEAPSIVHSRPAPSKAIASHQGTPDTLAAADNLEDRNHSSIGRAAPAGNNISPITFDAPPPRAVIIEE